MPAACWTDANLEHWATNGVFSASCTINFPTGYSSGHLLLLFLQTRSDSGGTIPAVSSGWTEIIPEFHADTGGGRAVYMACWGRVLDGTEGSSITLNNGVARTEWMCASVWIDAKLNGIDGGWTDDSASVAGSCVVPAMLGGVIPAKGSTFGGPQGALGVLIPANPYPASTDIVYLWFGAANDNSLLNVPAGFCGLEWIEHTASWGNATLGAWRTMEGVALPLARRPVVGFIGSILGEPYVPPPPPVVRTLEDDTTRVLEDGVTPRTLE